MNDIPVVRFFFVELVILFCATYADNLDVKVNYFLMLAGGYIIFIVYVAYMTLHADMLSEKTNYALAIKGMELYEIAATGYHPPFIRTEIANGQRTYYFYNTLVTVDVWEDFLRTSNSVQCSPERGWIKQGKTKHREYNRIMKWLNEKNYVMKHRPPSGNVSWRWVSPHIYNRLAMDWARPIPNLSELE